MAKTAKGAEQVRAARGARGQWTEAEQAAVCEAVIEAMAEGVTVAGALDGPEIVALAGTRAVTPGMVRRWMGAEEGRWGAYQAGKRALAMALAEEALQVARDSTGYSSAADKLLIDQLRWHAAKLAPQEFGDRQVVEHQGEQKLVIEVVEVGAPVAAPSTPVGNAVASGTVAVIANAGPVALPAGT